MTENAEGPLIWTDELIGRFWDHESRYPDRYFTYQYGDQLVREFLGRMPLPERAIDFGCGAGFLMNSLLAHGVPVAGADFSRESVALVRDRFAGAPGFLGALHADDLAQHEGQFDAAFVIEVIEHVTEARLATTFELVRRLLRPGGVIAVSTPNDEDLDVETVFCPCCRHTFHRWQHLRSWSVQSLGNALEGAGFQLKDVFTTDLALAKRRPLVRSAKALLRYVGRLAGRPGKKPHLLALAMRPPTP